MWGVPADHEYFERINPAQWKWYFYNFIEDNSQEVETNRNLLEYHAWFGNPELVGKIQEERAERGFEQEIDGGVRRGVRSSGDVRDLGNILDKIDTIEQDQATREKEIVPYNYIRWADFDLE